MTADSFVSEYRFGEAVLNRRFDEFLVDLVENADDPTIAELYAFLAKNGSKFSAAFSTNFGQLSVEKVSNCLFLKLDQVSGSRKEFLACLLHELCNNVDFFKFSKLRQEIEQKLKKLLRNDGTVSATSGRWLVRLDVFGAAASLRLDLT